MFYITFRISILKGVTIGSNVIIGANTLINKDIPNNTVAVGNPIKIIMTLEEYYIKRKNEYKDEAKELALSYYKRYSIIPPIDIFQEFFPLFLKDIKVVKELGFTFDGKYEDDVVKKFINHTPEFKNYNEFLKWCGIYNN